MHLVLDLNSRLKESRVGMGHVRLSILDLAGGQQPLHDEENGIHAVVNGELYDYASLRSELEGLGRRFKTNCDSELVVHLYVHCNNQYSTLTNDIT